MGLCPLARLAAVVSELSVDATVLLSVELYVRFTRVRFVLSVRCFATYARVVVAVRACWIGCPEQLAGPAAEVPVVFEVAIVSPKLLLAKMLNFILADSEPRIVLWCGEYYCKRDN
jgi:hypothetical protein